jgi:hypothetical protein
MTKLIIAFRNFANVLKEQLIHNTQATKYTNFFLKYLRYIITVSTCFNPQAIIISEQVSNKIAQNLII